MQPAPIPPHSTSVSLLVRLLKKSDEDVWKQFVHLYTPVLMFWAKKNGFQEADAENLVQEIFATLTKNLPKYKRLGGTPFRCWLFTIAGNKAKDAWKHRSARPLATGNKLPENGEGSFEALNEEDYRQLLLNRALGLIRPEFDDNTWTAFSCGWLDCLPVKEIATKLETSESAVNMARRRVLKRLGELLDELLDDW